MAYTARQLIIDSYYLSGIASRNLDEVSGQQLHDGLRLLNELLAVKTTNSELIPYFKEYQLNAVIGQEKYYIPDLISIESITFNIGIVRYATNKIARNRYFGTARADNINSLPFNFHMERTLNGANLYLYFLPADTYPLKLWGKFSFADITDYDFDLETIHELFYISYLRYGLAEYICADYNIQLQPQVAQRLREFENIISNVSPKDYSIKKMSNLQYKIGDNSYTTANFGAWRP